MIKRIIFDLDNTLIPWLNEWDSCVEQTYNFFNIPYEKKEFNKFYQAMLEYEKNHNKFDMIEMSKNFRNVFGKEIPNSFVEVWTTYLGDCVPNKDRKLIDLLKYLSSKYSLVVATNWFYNQQVSKLKKYGIYKYFDFVLTADKYLKKPYKEMFEVACEGFDKSEVIMVGDTFKTDIKSAMDFGLYSYYITKTDPRKGKKFMRIKEIYELKEYL